MIPLPRAFAALGHADFTAILRAELATVDGTHWPLEKACRHGGFPEPASVRVCQIAGPTPRGALQVVPVLVSFQEHQGAGCGGRPQTHHHLVDGEVILHPTGEGYLRVLDDSPSE
jgi:hypothetical protein